MYRISLKLLALILGISVFCRLALAGEPQVCISAHCFQVEIADDSDEQILGLMNRESLAEHAGMLFVFNQPGPHLFWMKNTLIPLDMIWINENNRIVYIQHEAEPCISPNCPQYGPALDVQYVLEINGGLARKLGIELGDQIVHQ